MAAHQPLTPNRLVRDFGARAAVTRDAVRALCEALPSVPPAALAHWKTLFGKWAGRALEKLPRHLARLADRYGISSAADEADALLFALQTYYALLVNLVAARFRAGDLLPDSPFSWYAAAPSAATRSVVDQLITTTADYRITPPPSADDGGCDLFKPLYHDLFPRPLRRQLGEYYTPDWLAGHVLDQVGYTGQPGLRLLDPACGSGTFLVLALRRLRGEGPGARDQGRSWCGSLTAAPTDVCPLVPRPSPLAPPFPIVGFDLNPLAVLTARANYLIAIADLLPAAGRVEIPVYLCDSILGDCPNFRREDGTVPLRAAAPACETGEFDYVVGNPPWIAWDNLPEDDRQATKPLWEHYGLFSLSGNEARHGGGKKDLSMLMLYATADRYLKSGGRLGMVITQTLFQTKGAGDGFRRFRLGLDGPPLRVLRVDDMVALRPFGDAANWTSTIVLQKGAATEYPVPYFRWGRGAGGEGRGTSSPAHPANCGVPRLACPTVYSALPDKPAVAPNSTDTDNVSPTTSPPSPIPTPSPPVPCFARPIDPAQPTSPWLVLSDGMAQTHSMPRGPADYSAHLGANSGGANGVYWLEVLAAAEGGVRIRNVAARGKHRIDTVEQAIEPDLIYPLLRWSGVRRYSATAGGHILLAQDVAARTGLDVNAMHQRYPRTLAYLERFRELLTGRAAYRRYQQHGPFYSMYNVGPYTVAPIKVVWRRMDRRLNAAVVEEQNDPLVGRRPVVPQETCVLLACDSLDEAHYICALLNSAIVNELLTACSVRGGKGFGTPGMLDFVPLRRFRPDDPRHAELAMLSRSAHAGDVDQSQHAIDRLATELCGLSS